MSLASNQIAVVISVLGSQDAAGELNADALRPALKLYATSIHTAIEIKYVINLGAFLTKFDYFLSPIERYRFRS